MKVFEDNNLLMKSVEFAIHPPTIVIKKKQSSLSPSFREVANFKMTDVQKNTMKALVDDDRGFEKLRNAKVEITIDKDKSNNKDNEPTNINEVNEILRENGNYQSNNLQKSIKEKSEKNNNNILNENKEKINDIYQNNSKDIDKIKYKPVVKKNNKLQIDGESDFKNIPQINGPVTTPPYLLDVDDKKDNSNIKNNSFSSFLQVMDAKYTKPIQVLMKMAEEPDTKIQSEFSKMEKKRDGFEKKLFDKAKKEFKLITEITAKELQVNLQHELVPFFVVSKNDLKGLKDIVQKNFQSKGDMRFLEVDHDEFNKKYPYVNIFKNSTNLMDQVNLNRYTYEKILNLFSTRPVMHDIYYDKIYQSRVNAESKENELKFGNELKKKIKDNLNERTNIQMAGSKLNEQDQKVNKSQFETKTINTELFKDRKKNYIKESIRAIGTDNQSEESEENNKEGKEKDKANSISKPKASLRGYNTSSTSIENGGKLTVKSSNDQNGNSNEPNQDSDFDVDTCLTLASKFKNLNLNCTPGSANYEALKKQYMSSFLQLSTRLVEKLKGGDDDFINVKFCIIN